ncbi:unnamed protein product [Rotaria sordida]|uniref:Uncharacterized protein n=1 Tax=Rotaria sordida TaxID=392033 RepID=A0A814IA67_9BILA|nr:unnamed protein product [Rotaria sordida]CAF1020772.1 unnamed protein product [Rotaria sordida]CAF1038663.1 unnamed protein product [Rotaria sordida]CAF3539209.1 unnamed protein product [Rotaria sordida]CAF3605183.1 unnamed protein product [Rotaria sordida]
MTYSTKLFIVLQGILFLSLNILLQFPYVNTNEVELRKFLFLERPYDRRVCPVVGINKVHTNLILLQIESVDEKAQVVTSNVQLICAWCDPYMSWNDSDYNITELSVGSNYLWTPDVVLVNSADGKYSRNREHYALILRNDGYVRFMFQDLWKTICKVRATYFPFDYQHCTIIIRSGSRDGQSIKFIQRRPIVGRSFIRGEWELINSYTEITDERVSDFGQVDYSLVRFTLILKRNYVHYFMKIILPFTLVSFVTLFTFLLPPQTGEKLTLNVTILLSLVIYLQLLSGYIPKSDDETPILTLFCNANFFLVILSCIMTVYVSYLYHRPTTSNIACVPTHMKIILLDYLSPLVYCNVNKHLKNRKVLKYNIQEKRPRRLSSIEKRMCQLFTVTTPVQSSNHQAVELLKVLHQVKTHIRTQWLLPLNFHNEYDVGNEFLKLEYRQRLDEWQHVALVLDRLFFILFIIAMPCTALLFIFPYSSIGNNFRSNLTNITSQMADAKCDSI